MTDAPTPAEIRLTLYRCGLSQADAAAVAGVQDRVVRKWLRGEYRAPAEKWQHIAELDRRLDRAADTMVAKAIRRGVRSLRLTLPRTDDEADAIGWPCPGAFLALVARVIERLPDGVAVVPVYAGDEAEAAE